MRVVVDGSVSKTFLVALEKQSLNFGDATVELEQGCKLGELHVSVETLAFLEDPD